MAPQKKAKPAPKKTVPGRDDGKFVARLGTLRDLVAARAKEQGVSMNTWLVSAVAQVLGVEKDEDGNQLLLPHLGQTQPPLVPGMTVRNKKAPYQVFQINTFSISRSVEAAKQVDQRPFIKVYGIDLKTGKGVSAQLNDVQVV
ncbi:hypothetical protein Voja6_00087 [Pseudomonas phage vB_PpuM-Voja-6]